ncbi:hypothetical protein WICPIJ_004323 [Wickerhamomyces pijperi]|uniref:ATPase expression protein 1 n=1 Tax=Wickerhamomyces pijperi TaxID=599730 RepID=A0A9P8Q5Q8_WICPI|nr:hypothetical protein WICPIJ_004323 [Wickerhamomyces pijperi]
MSAAASSTLKKTSPRTIVNHGSRSLDFVNNPTKNKNNESSTTTHSFEVPKFAKSKLKVDNLILSSRVSAHPFLVPSTRDRFIGVFKKHGHNYGDIYQFNSTNSEDDLFKSGVTFTPESRGKDRLLWFQDNFKIDELETHVDLQRFQIKNERYQLAGLIDLPDLIHSLDAVSADQSITRDSKLDYFVYKFESEPEESIEYMKEALQGNEHFSAETFVKVVNRVIASSPDQAKLKSYASEIVQFYQYVEALNPERFSADLDVNYALLSYFVYAGYTSEAAVVLKRIFIDRGLTVNDDLLARFVHNYLKGGKAKNSVVKFAELHPFRSAIFTAFNPQIFQTLLNSCQNLSEVASLIKIAKWKGLDLEQLFKSNESRIVAKVCTLTAPGSYISQTVGLLAQLQPNFSKLSQVSIAALLITTLKNNGSYIYATSLIKLLSSVDEELLRQITKINEKRVLHLPEVGNPGFDKVSQDAFLQALAEKKKESL